MATIDSIWVFNTPRLSDLTSLLRRPARLQIAALCYRDTKKGPEVLLVTSRGKGRWILPKGWPELHKPAFETAVIEAYEEAGIVGQPEKKPYARFRSVKGLNDGLSIRTKVLVFRIRFEKQLDTFPEKGQRQIAWLPIAEAMEKADEPGLRKVLKRFRTELENKRHTRPKAAA
jgi:8-oxo-dGTP pyrophosphatase MutT (NUDIX family)